MGTGFDMGEQPPQTVQAGGGERCHADTVPCPRPVHGVRDRRYGASFLGIDGEVGVRQLLQELFKSQGSGAIGEAHRLDLAPRPHPHRSLPVSGATQASVMVQDRDSIAGGSHIGLEIGESQARSPTKRAQGVLAGLERAAAVRIGPEFRGRGSHPHMIDPRADGPSSGHAVTATIDPSPPTATYVPGEPRSELMTTDTSIANTVTWPAHDPATWRILPDSYVPLDQERIATLLAAEWERFSASTPESGALSARSRRTLPLGVPSSFQYWDPHPVSVVSAKGAWLMDVDGRRLLDLSMGFGAMLVGHLNPAVVAAVTAALQTGTLFVTPAPSASDMADRFCERFDLDQVRFANSGTEADMYAVRAARAYTGRRAIIKIEGGYHGGYDALSVSVKPEIAEAGPEDAPVAVVPFEVEAGTVYPVPYNNLERLAQILDQHGRDIAAVVMEPVLENIGIVLPDAGYLVGVRQLCDDHGVLLVFDEVKTGLTAGYGGAAQRLGVKPDLVTLAKSIGGGLPLAAFGGTAEVMATVTDGRMAHFGTYNGNPLVMAAAAAVDEICTRQALAAAEQVNDKALEDADAIIREYALPAHTVGFGVKGAITWAPTPVRNYRDYKRTDFAIAELSWLWGVNRGVLTPPGLDEQWLVSLAHTHEDMASLTGEFRELAEALRS
jgi:glutamate-1-semialdehyde 2,1-aminomutase